MVVFDFVHFKRDLVHTPCEVINLGGEEWGKGGACLVMCAHTHTHTHTHTGGQHQDDGKHSLSVKIKDNKLTRKNSSTMRNVYNILAYTQSLVC